MTSKLKYIPVLRYRTSEKSTLNSVSISSKILPLIEVVTEKPKINSRKTCIEEIKDFVDNNNTKILVDFPLYIKLYNNSIEAVSNFIRGIQTNPNLRVNYFNQLIGSNIIPVITYNPNISYVQGFLTTEINALRSSFEQLAFRVFINHGTNALNEIKNLLQKGDLLILDLDTASHSNSAFQAIYTQLTTLTQQKGATSILIRSAINTDITNTGLTNGQVVNGVDNSLLKNYQNYNFDAFGDFCGIKKDDLTKGGRPSPGCLFYNWPTNSFYGHKGLYLDITTFTSLVVPSLINSSQWSVYSSSHKQNCNGCKIVQNIVNRNESANNAPKWKVIASSHYLYTMEEFL
ncbi:hypothetical protein P9265_15055 [Schinkia azotoformans]|uniref:beta family protein n=1 Tax=Schinkia azotoformans TaxID=1454 RepID=UPI002E1E37F0|nr:hypothetical protein [Schinkia azotoformans]